MYLNEFLIGTYFVFSSIVNEFIIDENDFYKSGIGTIIYSKLDRPYEEPGCVFNCTQFIMIRIGDGMDVKVF